ncbi:hypothetical protein TrRE_jg1862, partial [Triparma retinervis]
FVYFLSPAVSVVSGAPLSVPQRARRSEVKLKRVTIEISDDESEDGEEGEEVERIAKEVGKEMAGKFKKINVQEEEEEEEEEVRVGGAKMKVAKSESSVTLTAFVSALIPLGGTPGMSRGLDSLAEKDLEAGAIYDGAMRLSAVLDPATVKAAVEKAKEEVNCNFYNGLTDHADLMMKLGGGR